MNTSSVQVPATFSEGQKLYTGTASNVSFQNYESRSGQTSGAQTPAFEQPVKVEPPQSFGASGSKIEPRYVGELEAALGKLRMENASLQESLSAQQQRNQALTQENASLTSRVQEVNKILEENNSLKWERSRTTEELDSRNREFRALSEKNKEVLEQLFRASFDKYAFEATVKDNANLREHIGRMEELVQTLQQTFENYKAETAQIHADNGAKGRRIAELELDLQQLAAGAGSQSRQLQEQQQEQARLQGALRQKDEMVRLLQSELAASVASVQKLQYVVAHGTPPPNAN